MTSEDLPLPDTPVTAVNTPTGKATSSPFRLFCLTPFRTSIRSGDTVRRISGTSILYSPERYFPVTDLGSAMMSSTLPAATTSPPCTPAPGPMSTT